MYIESPTNKNEEKMAKSARRSKNSSQDESSPSEAEEDKKTAMEPKKEATKKEDSAVGQTPSTNMSVKVCKTRRKYLAHSCSVLQLNNLKIDNN